MLMATLCIDSALGSLFVNFVRSLKRIVVLLFEPGFCNRYLAHGTKGKNLKSLVSRIKAETRVFEGVFELARAYVSEEHQNDRECRL